MVDAATKIERIGTQLNKALEIAHTAHADTPPGIDTELRYLHRKVDALLDAVLDMLPMAGAGDAALDALKDLLPAIHSQSDHIGALIGFEEHRQSST